MAAPNSIANQPLRLQVSEEPSYYNDEMLIGAGLGAITFSFVGAAIGGAIGAYIGKRRMEHEAEHGKEIGEPSLFNKSLAMGALAPLAVATLAIDTVVRLMGTESFVQTANNVLQHPELLTSSPALMTIAALGAAWVVATPFTAVIGAFSGKSEMTKEKKQAVSQLQNYAMSQHYGQTQEPQIYQGQEPSRSFAKMVEDQRIQPAQIER